MTRQSFYWTAGDFKKALELDPDNESYKTNLARVQAFTAASEGGYLNDDDEDSSREAVMKKWSAALRNKTYTEIADMLTCEYPGGELRWAIGSSLLPYARFKNINGKTGRMTVENASDNYHAPPDQRHYEIICDDGTTETFPDVDCLIDAGWALD